ncbi:unnamed protein product, partial [marine sediment metagenome]
SPFKQKTAYEIGLGIPAEPLFRSLNQHKLGATTLMSSQLEIYGMKPREAKSPFFHGL